MNAHALYSLRTDGDQWRITKFVDGDVESSYLTTHSECQCPAGHRHTCRHRQMLPSMLAHGLCDTHWFFCFDTGGQIVDFNGTSKHLLDQLALGNELAERVVLAEDDVMTIYEPAPLPAGIVLLSRTQEETVEDTEAVLDRAMGASADDWAKLEQALAPVPAGQHCQGSKSWRRL